MRNLLRNQGIEEILKQFDENHQNRRTFQDAINTDVQDVKTTVLDIKKAVNATCHLADQTVAILLGDTHINQEGKVVESEDIEPIKVIEGKSIEVGDSIELHPIEADNRKIDNRMGTIEKLFSETNNYIKEEALRLKDNIYDQGWNDESINEITDWLSNLDSKLDDVESNTNLTTDAINNMGDLDFSQLDIVSDKLDDLTATLDRTDLDELNSDINTMTKICTDNRADIARLHDSMNAQFNQIIEMLTTSIKAPSWYIDPAKDVNPRLTQMGDAIDVQFKNIEKSILDRYLALDNFKNELPKYFEAHQASTKHIIDELFIKYSEKLNNQTHSQIEDQEGSLYAMENKLDDLDVNVKKLIDNIAFLDDHSKKCTDKELGEKIHDAISYGFTNLNTHVEDMVNAVKRIKEESILTNYEVHTGENQNG